MNVESCRKPVIPPRAGLPAVMCKQDCKGRLRTEASLDAAQALPDARAGLLLAHAAPAEALAETDAALLLLLLLLLRLLRLLEPRHAAAGHGAAQDASETAAGLPGTEPAPGAPNRCADYSPAWWPKDALLHSSDLQLQQQQQQQHERCAQLH